MNEQIHLNAIPHVRFWQRGQIALTAKARVESLLKIDRQNDARSIAEEWLIK